MAENEQKREPPKRITKIKCKKGLWFFAWEVYREQTSNWDQHTLSCKDQAEPELIGMFLEMSRHGAEICEIDYIDGKMVTSGITLSYGKEDATNKNCYLVITMQKELQNSNSPLILNTPPRPEMPEENMPQEYCWSDELCADIDALEEWAWRYIDGYRAQQKLDLEGREQLENKGDGTGGSTEIIDTENMEIGA